MANSPATVSLKLLIDTKHQRVLFAEAGKDCVDFLFPLLSLPAAAGTLIRLLSKDSMVCSLGKLYGSVESLSNTYTHPYFRKDALLEPTVTITLGGSANVLGLLSNNEATAKKSFYYCSYCRDTYETGYIFVSDDPKAICTTCRHTIYFPATYVALSPAKGESSSGGGGYVKRVVTYMIMDDLEVSPMSTISSVTLLNKLYVKDVGALEEKVVQLGMKEV